MINDITTIYLVYGRATKWSLWDSKYVWVYCSLVIRKRKQQLYGSFTKSYVWLSYSTPTYIAAISYGRLIDWSVWWWHHDMETLNTVLAVCGENRPVTGGYPSQGFTNMELWWFLYCQVAQAHLNKFNNRVIDGSGRDVTLSLPLYIYYIYIYCCYDIYIKYIYIYTVVMSYGWLSRE